VGSDANEPRNYGGNKFMAYFSRDVILATIRRGTSQDFVGQVKALRQGLSKGVVGIFTKALPMLFTDMLQVESKYTSRQHSELVF
jgi:hypothetical protein